VPELAPSITIRIFLDFAVTIFQGSANETIFDVIASIVRYGKYPSISISDITDGFLPLVNEIKSDNWKTLSASISTNQLLKIACAICSK